MVTMLSRPVSLGHRQQFGSINPSVRAHEPVDVLRLAGRLGAREATGLHPFLDGLTAHCAYAPRRLEAAEIVDDTCAQVLRSFGLGHHRFQVMGPI